MNSGAPQTLGRAFFRNLAGAKPDLFKAILRFNARTHSQAPGQATPCQQEVINASGRARALVSGSLDSGFWDFEEQARRLALLDNATFERLVFYWGAAFCAPKLNQVVLKNELSVLSKQLGPELLDFSRGRGQFCFPKMFAPFKYPDIPDLATLVPLCGLRAYRICSAPWPQILKKIQEKRLAGFRERYPDPVPAGEASPADFRAVWFSMKKILLKEVAPEWTPCFS